MAKILLIEDDVPTAELIKMILHPRGYEVLHTTDGSQAINLAKDFQPDMILLDVMLPGLDGYSIQNGLCEEESLRKIPVIVMTSKAQMEEVFKTAANVVGFIEKPFSIKDFLDKIKTVLT